MFLRKHFYPSRQFIELELYLFGISAKSGLDYLGGNSTAELSSEATLNIS